MPETLARVQLVVHTLSKNGLAGVLARFGFSRYIPFFSRRNLPDDLPVRIRKSLEELGGAYIKLGQLLSIRPDLIPHEYCAEFAKLQDCVTPDSLDTIKEVIEKSFNKPISTFFSHIDPKPLGSASIAQVHKARTKTGRPVAVKVQKPNVASQFKSDIRIMEFIAHKLQKHIPQINPVLIAQEFERYTKQELDFTMEATHIDAFEKQNKNVHLEIPHVYWTHTCEHVLTMDYFEGTLISHIPDKEKERTSGLVVDALIDQLFH